MHRNVGFTLIELMVALALSSIIVLAAMATFQMQNDTYTVVDQTTEVQQNMRAIADLIERDARSTAMGLPEEVAACGVDSQNAADVVFVTDSTAIVPFDAAGNLAENQPVFAEINNPGAALTTGAGQVLALDRIILEQNVVPPQAAYNGNADFQVNGGVIVANTDQPSQGNACGIITAVSPVAPFSITVDFLTPNAVPWTPGQQLAAVPAHVYQIVVVNNVSVLQRNGTLLASDVEDLQAVWFVDENQDGIRDPGEMLGAAGEPNYASVGAAGITDYRRLREMRINVVVRTRDSGPGSNSGSFIQAGMQAMENRNFVLVPNDGFLRRVHTTTVRLRNVGFRGRMGKKVGV